jgi:hypothetical protein
MNNPFKRLDLVTLIAVFVFATSLALMDFADLRWETNQKSYIGFAVFIAFLIFKAMQSTNRAGKP